MGVETWQKAKNAGVKLLGQDDIFSNRITALTPSEQFLNIELGKPSKKQLKLDKKYFFFIESLTFHIEI